MGISNLIAIIALIVSIVGIYLSYKNHKTTIEWNFHKENMRQTEQTRQNYYARNINRIDLMPHFHLVLDKEISVKRNSKEEILVIPISLINVGRENATNIRLVPILKDDTASHFIKTDSLNDEPHGIRDYLDKRYAVIGDVINFTASCKKHDQYLNVYFKIRFDDIAGRTYEQDFRFLYGFQTSNKISMNHDSNLPKCIDENDEIIDPKK